MYLSNKAEDFSPSFLISLQFAIFKLFLKSGSQNLVRLSKYISLAHLWMPRPLLYLLTYVWKQDPTYTYSRTKSYDTKDLVFTEATLRAQQLEVGRVYRNCAGSKARVAPCLLLTFPSSWAI